MPTISPALQLGALKHDAATGRLRLEAAAEPENPLLRPVPAGDELPVPDSLFAPTNLDRKEK